MRTYYIAINNTYNAIEAPLIVLAGYYNEKVGGYKCITQLNNDEYKIVPYIPYNSKDLITEINNNTIMVSMVDDYTIFLNDFSQTDNPPIPFNFHAFQNIYIINENVLSILLEQELPALYNSDNVLNMADNAGNSAVLNAIYDNLYLLFYDSIISLGTGTYYNQNWELVFFNAINILQNIKYPAALLGTLLQINTQTSTQRFSIATTISKLAYQIIGTSVPVHIVYDTGLWNIRIFYQPGDWFLGEAGKSELGDTTYLSDGNAGFLFIINLIIARIMPAFVKWEISYLPMATFETEFNISDVNINDYINPDIRYDAYMVVNNNNQFNTKGYYLV